MYSKTGVFICYNVPYLQQYTLILWKRCKNVTIILWKKKQAQQNLISTIKKFEK